MPRYAGPTGLRSRYSVLYAEAFPLTTNSLSQIAKLGLDHVGHRFARCVECVTDLLPHDVDGYAIP